MHLRSRNINEGFTSITRGMTDGSFPTERTGSRNGDVIRVTEPVMITFTHPNEKVLFNPARDVNPFSVIFECLWALAGRDDVESISYYTSRMRQFSDDGKTWHGAYGKRWRSHFGYDQLDAAAEHLAATKGSRRVIVQMWDPRVDGHGTGRDYPCNGQIMLAVRGGRLNLTIINRSNDIVWGLFGTNYPLFAFLGEYMAARVGVSLGAYHHFTNDLHAYQGGKGTAKWEPEKWLAAADWSNQDLVEYRDPFPPGNVHHAHAGPPWNPVPLVSDPAAFEAELPLFVGNAYGPGVVETVGRRTWAEPFFETVAKPMSCAFARHKAGDTAAGLTWAASIKADDWRIACTAWLKRRAK